MTPNTQVTNIKTINNVALKKSIAKILKDPFLMEQLCDRVYQLMLADLQQQSDRTNIYKW